MGITIIMKDTEPKGRTRVKTDQELLHCWGTTSFKSEEDKDKCAFIERKLKKKLNADNSCVSARLINELK